MLLVNHWNSVYTEFMDTVRFVKSFSKGQITIPKEFRDMFGISDNFWLKLYINDGKIIAEPVEKKNNKEVYRQKLLNIKEVWDLEPEIKGNKEQVEKQIANRVL